MTPDQKLAIQVKALLWKKGQKALEMAKKSVLQEKIPSESLQAALEYFMASWEDVAHPALLALACEAVGGSPDSTTHVGVAFVLLAGGADVHDDIIDQSTWKYSKPTVLGKFGKDIAILVGDALLFKGLYALNEACESLPKNQKHEILELTKQAFFRISSAEAKEASLHGKTEPSVAEEYLDMIRTKAAVGEVSMRIGALLGGGSAEEVDALGHFGKTIGILLTIRDEFIDTFEVDELKNRAEKECLPLPILYTLKDSKKAKEIFQLLKQEKMTEKDIEQILDIAIDSKETRRLKREMQLLVKEEIQRLRLFGARAKIFNLMLRSTVEDI